jgi:hypothetical protein
VHGPDPRDEELLLQQQYAEGLLLNALHVTPECTLKVGPCCKSRQAPGLGVPPLSCLDA